MRHFVILFGFLLAVASCAPTPTSTSTSAIDTTTQFKNNVSTIYGTGGKNVVDGTGLSVASNIIWKDSLGNLRSLDSLRGKIILLNFWATWCAPCDAEMPDLESISESMGPDVVVLEVSVLDYDPSLFDRVKLFAETRKMKFQVIVDAASKSYTNYGGVGTQVPWSFAIDRTGHIVHKFIGQQSRSQFMDILSQIP